MTVFDTSPLVGEDTSEQIRVYLAWDRRDAIITEIGRTSNTGTGEVGTRISTSQLMETMSQMELVYQVVHSSPQDNIQMFLHGQK